MNKQNIYCQFNTQLPCIVQTLGSIKLNNSTLVHNNSGKMQFNAVFPFKFDNNLSYILQIGVSNQKEVGWQTSHGKHFRSGTLFAAQCLSYSISSSFTVFEYKIDKTSSRNFKSEIIR